jgi:hypothetical protein
MFCTPLNLSSSIIAIVKKFLNGYLGLSPLSEKDLQDLDFACTHADLIGFSFVETLADMDSDGGHCIGKQAVLPVQDGV